MKKIDIMTKLREVPLFKSLDEDGCRALARISSIEQYSKDDMLFMQGDIGHELILLTDGIISVYMQDDKFSENIVTYFKPIEFIAEPFQLKSIPYPASAVFKSPGSVIKIELSAFKTQFLTNADISQTIINSLVEKVLLLQQNLTMSSIINAKERVIYYYKFCKFKDYPFKQHQIASKLSMSPETLSRHLKTLQEEKLVKKVGKSFVWIG